MKKISSMKAMSAIDADGISGVFLISVGYLKIPEMDDQIIATIEIALKMYVAISPVPIQTKLVGVTVPSSINLLAPKNFGISSSDKRYETPITATVNPNATKALLVAFLSVIVFANSNTKAAIEAIPSNIYVQYKFVEIQVDIPSSAMLAQGVV